MVEPMNFECPICMNIYIIPIKLSCGHTYCIECVEQIVYLGEDHWKCPMDRQLFDPMKETNLKLNESVYKAILLNKKDEFVELAKKKLDIRKSNKNKKNEVVLVYGNEHKLLESKDDNKHMWTAFLRIGEVDPRITKRFKDLREEADLETQINYKIEKDLSSINEKSNQQKLNINDYIESVTFKLHPTFNPPNIIVNKSPFELRRCGWGTFEITLKIKFKSKFKQEDLELKIDLSFSKEITFFKRVIALSE